MSSVRRLALGTAQFGLPYGIANRSGRVPAADVPAILRTAREAGFDTLDTAIGYGESEAVLGASGVTPWRVFTKLPPMRDATAPVEEWVASEVAGSLRRLQVPSLAGVLLHRADDLLERDGSRLYAALGRERDAGRLGKIGISIYGTHVLDAAFDRFDLDVVQAPFNVVDRRLSDSGWLDRLRARNVEVHVRSVFLQGLLLMPAEARPAYFAPWRDLWARWDAWLADQRTTPVEACLSHVLSHPAIDRVIVGVDSLSQVQEIAAAARRPARAAGADLAEADLALIEPSRWPRFEAVT